MIPYQPTNIVLSEINNDIEFLTLLRNGYLILRHILPFRTICAHSQRHPKIHDIVSRFGAAPREDFVLLPKKLDKDFSVSFVAGPRLADQVDRNNILLSHSAKIGGHFRQWQNYRCGVMWGRS